MLSKDRHNFCDSHGPALHAALPPAGFPRPTLKPMRWIFSCGVELGGAVRDARAALAARFLPPLGPAVVPARGLRFGGEGDAAWAPSGCVLNSSSNSSSGSDDPRAWCRLPATDADRAAPPSPGCSAGLPRLVEQPAGRACLRPRALRRLAQETGDAPLDRGDREKGSTLKTPLGPRRDPFAASWARDGETI
jgi:hypothetical protein